MAGATELIKLLADQIQVQRQQMEQVQQHRAEMEKHSQQHREEMQTLLKLLDVQKYDTGEDDSSTHHPQLSTAAIPPFAVFDSTSEPWPDYWSRFCTFVVASAVSDQRKAQVFLTNQTAAVYKQLANLAAQQTPPKDINKLTMLEIFDFMKEQFDPKLFIVHERFQVLEWHATETRRNSSGTGSAYTSRRGYLWLSFGQRPTRRSSAPEVHMICQQRSCLKGSLQDQGHRADFRPCCSSCHWDWRRGKGCQGNCLRFKGQAGQQGPPEQEEGSTAEPSAISFQRPAEVLPMWKGPQSNGLPLQRS